MTIKKLISIGAVALCASGGLLTAQTPMQWDYINSLNPSDPDDYLDIIEILAGGSFDDSDFNEGAMMAEELNSLCMQSATGQPGAQPQCPKITIRCKTTDQIRDRLGPGGAQFCDPKNCEIWMHETSCRRFRYKDGDQVDKDTIKPGLDYKDMPRRPTCYIHIKYGCLGVHELNHGEDLLNAPLPRHCATEKKAYQAGLDCMVHYYNLYCTTNPPQIGSPPTDDQCARLQAEIEFNLRMLAFVTCLCSVNAPHGSAHCAACVNACKGSNPSPGRSADCESAARAYCSEGQPASF